MRYSKITRLNADEIAILWYALDALRLVQSDYSNADITKMQKKLTHIIQTLNR